MLVRCYVLTHALLLPRRCGARATLLAMLVKWEQPSILNCIMTFNSVNHLVGVYVGAAEILTVRRAALLAMLVGSW